jgi:hypothetical protein
LTTDKFKPLIFSMSGFTFSYTSHDFVWLLLVACTILLHNRIHTEESTVVSIVFKITPRHRQRRKHSLSIVKQACLPRRCISTVAARTTQKTPLLYFCEFVRFRENVFTEPLLIETGWITPLFYRCVRVCCRHSLAKAVVYSHRLATGINATIKYYHIIFLEGLRKTAITSVCVVDVPAEMRTSHLPNATQKR